MQKDFYSNKKESQAKRSKKTSFYCKFHNFHVRGSSHVINTNSKHVRAQINSRRRIKAREKSVELKLPVRTFDDETRLTSRELLQVIKNKEVKEFKNGISAQLKGRSTYVSYQFPLLGMQIGDIAELFNCGVGKRSNKFAQSALKQSNCIVYFVAQNVLFYI